MTGDPKADLHRYLQWARDALLWRQRPAKVVLGLSVELRSRPRA